MKVGEQYVYKGNVITVVLISGYFVHFKLQDSNTKSYVRKEFFNETFIPATELILALY
jgi:hypothetical protein